jgi:hypothetical protein
MLVDRAFGHSVGFVTVRLLTGGLSTLRGGTLCGGRNARHACIIASLVYYCKYFRRLNAQYACHFSKSANYPGCSPQSTDDEDEIIGPALHR